MKKPKRGQFAPAFNIVCEYCGLEWASITMFKLATWIGRGSIRGGQGWDPRLRKHVYWCLRICRSCKPKLWEGRGRDNMAITQGKVGVYFKRCLVNKQNRVWMNGSKRVACYFPKLEA